MARADLKELLCRVDEGWSMKTRCFCEENDFSLCEGCKPGIKVPGTSVSPEAFPKLVDSVSFPGLPPAHATSCPADDQS